MPRRTLADDLVDDVSRTFINTEEFGQSVTRTFNGVDEPVDVIWTEQTPHRDISIGERGVRNGVLLVAASQAVDRGDKWTINGELWVIAPTEWLGAVVHGMRTIMLQRNELKTTREPSRGLI